MKKIITAVLVLISGFTMAQTASSDAGHTLFTARCASCHAVNKKLVGPALANVDKRRKEEWIIRFVQSSQTMVKNNDATAVTLFNENNQVLMPDHPDLTKAGIQNIIAYIKKEAMNAADVSANNGVKRPAERKGTNLPFSSTDYWIFLVIGALCLFLVIGFNTMINAVTVAHANQQAP